MIITIDGSTGVGKTTAAEQLSNRLGFRHLVGGVFFRSLTYSCLQKKTSEENQIVSIAQKISPEIRAVDGKSRIFISGTDVTDHLWLDDVNNKVPEVANLQAVREIRTNWLQMYAKNKNIVADGRTLGTEVFPQAGNKFYLICNLPARAKLANKSDSERRRKEVELDKITLRDQRDREAKIDKFQIAPDAHIIDVTCLSRREVVEKMIDLLVLDAE